MNTARRFFVGMVGLAAVLALTGCGQDPKDLQIQACQERVGQLERENADLRSKYAAAMAERDAALARANSLQSQLDQLRAAQAVPAPAPMPMPSEEVKRGDFTERGGVAWADIPEEILFDSGKADLRGTARAKLQSIASQLRQNYAGRQYLVVGHTDTDPINKSRDKWSDNLDLSINRGAAVTRELYRLGIDSASIIAGGQGEHKPKASNASRQGKQTNRRVQVVAITLPDTTSGSASTSVEPSNEIIIAADTTIRPVFLP